MKPGSRCLLAAVMLLPALSSAARRPSVVTYDTATLAEGDVELEFWVDFLSNRRVPSEWRWWVGPRWAPFEGFEVSALLAMTQPFEDPATQGGASAQF